MNYIGSEWQKWDLHIHTPYTKLSDNFSSVNGEDVWKTYCDKLEKSDVEVFGITDYFCVENYFIFIDKHKGYYPQSKKVFFPNIELRLEVSVNKKAEEVNIHLLFSDKVSKSKLDSLLSKLNTNITIGGAKVTCKELCGEQQFKSAGIIYSHLQEVLKEVFGSEACYLIIAASNNAGLRADNSSPRKSVVTDEIDKVCDGFFGGIQNVEYYLRTDRYETEEISFPKPVISGSDCHSFEDVYNFLGKRFTRVDTQTGKDIIEKDITWIKGEKTFEGLRQILHEPQYRKIIVDIAPRQPIRKIEKIKFDFPEGVRIKNKSSNEYQDLCIKNLKKEIFLSPYFTCFIGGRGTGKSTIINTIAERLGTQTDFFHPSQNTLYLADNSKCDLGNTHKSYVEIEGTNDIEFVSQGRVEKLTEGKALTKLIFEERILQPNSKIQELKTSVDKHTELIDDQNKLIAELRKTQGEILERRKEKLTHESIVKSIEDPLYSEITEKIKALSERLAEFDNSKFKYTVIIERLRALIEEIQVDENRVNDYENRLKEIRSYILLIEEFLIVDNKVTVKRLLFDEAKTLREEIKRELDAEQINLKLFFEQKGTSEESIKDSQNANVSLANVVSNIKTLTEKASLIKSKLKINFDTVKDIFQLKNQSEIIIKSTVEELSAKLDRKNENVSSISYVYKFDKHAYENALFEDVKQTFHSYYIPNTSWEDIRSLLFQIQPDDSILNKPFIKYSSELKAIIDNGYDRSRNYVNVVSNIFCEILNYRIYQYLIYKHFFDVFKYVEIEGFYGSKELKSCSFGQKCTAVIVTLLMTGVKPLIIDEPEAHLDNKLIADYLVDLIKERKADRQIIFATHNANFVINGDAELIYILEVPENDDCTVLTATTIESKIHREKLLKLEGGRAAFEKREKRLLKTTF
jgi:exonuclease SbcC